MPRAASSATPVELSHLDASLARRTRIDQVLALGQEPPVTIPVLTRAALARGVLPEDFDVVEHGVLSPAREYLWAVAVLAVT